MALITRGDFSDTWLKIKQRGSRYIFSKFNPFSKSRVTNTFNNANIESSDWWIIPEVRLRWNQLITGKPDTNYETYFTEKYLAGRKDLVLFSAGCGEGNHEMRLAQSGHFAKVMAVDLATELIKKATAKAESEQIKNIEFSTTDFYEIDFEDNSIDVFLFNSSLHHFKNVEKILLEKIKPALKENGFILINEYVGPARFQWTVEQIKACNNVLKRLPEKFRKQFRSGSVKLKVNKPGILRMWLTDPSESIESNKITAVLNAGFKVLEEKPYGGNMLMPVLKNIAHNFLGHDEETKAMIKLLFDSEDEFLKNNPSNFIFGVYQNKG